MTLTREVLVEGDGVAAACCARLLLDAAVPCRLLQTARPKLPAVLLGEQSQALFRELFPVAAGGADLFEGFPRVGRRIVLWGQAKEPVELPHRGVVVSEAELLRRLWERVGSVPLADSANADGWVIVSSRGSMPGVADLRFGTRHARLSLVELRSDAGEEACWVESVAGGWLFALALGGGRATLIGVGAATEDLLAESRLVAGVVERLLEDAKEAPAYPRMLQSFTRPGLLACGSAAMGFDPLCGEGTGNAVREAFLAAGAVRAALAGENVADLLAHYSSRLRHGFVRHLEMCRQFYSTGGASGFWAAECDALEAGVRELRTILPQETEPRYRLVDRDLVAIGS